MDLLDGGIIASQAARARARGRDEVREAAKGWVRRSQLSDPVEAGRHEHAHEASRMR
jgi:hypothetical protein